LKYHINRRLLVPNKSMHGMLYGAFGATLIVSAFFLTNSNLLGRISSHRWWFHTHSKAAAAGLSVQAEQHAAKVGSGSDSNTDTATAPSNIKNQPSSTSGSTPKTGSAAPTVPGSASATIPTAGSGTAITTVYTTAYTYFDNTPAGSADIAFPHSEYPATIHEKAGGIGTYNDPLTLAVGHVISGGRDTPDFAPGTRFYLPDVRKYAIVEDTCGDGGSPQSVACHNLSTAATGASLWLDLWIGGSASDSKSTVQKCAGTVTDSTGALHTVVKDPSANYAVSVGPVFQNGYCIQPSNKGFGNTLVTQ
jgi:hypothetical protein